VEVAGGSRHVASPAKKIFWGEKEDKKMFSQPVFSIDKTRLVSPQNRLARFTWAPTG
jgi:hypothetical protein